MFVVLLSDEDTVVRAFGPYTREDAQVAVDAVRVLFPMENLDGIFVDVVELITFNGHNYIKP